MIPNTFINVLTGVGAKVAAQNITGQNFQAVLLVDASGSALNDALVNTVNYSSPKISGNAALTQNLLTFTSAYNVGKIFINSIEIVADYTAAQTTESAQVKVHRFGTASGGFNVTGWSFLNESNQIMTGFSIRNRTSVDLGAQMEISGVVGSLLCQQKIGRLHTAAGIVGNNFTPLWPTFPQPYRPIILTSGQSIGVLLSCPVVASNPVTNTYIVNLSFDII